MYIITEGFFKKKSINDIIMFHSQREREFLFAFLFTSAFGSPFYTEIWTETTTATG